MCEEENALTIVCLCDITWAEFTSTIRFSRIRRSLWSSGPWDESHRSPPSGSAPSLLACNKNTVSWVFLFFCIMSSLNCIFHTFHPYFRPPLVPLPFNSLKKWDGGMERKHINTALLCELTFVQDTLWRDPTWFPSCYRGYFWNPLPVYHDNGLWFVAIVFVSL